MKSYRILNKIQTKLVSHWKVAYSFIIKLRKKL